MFKLKILITIATSVMLLFACDKQNEWLDKKANKSDVVLSSLEDYQALLDNDGVFNQRYPALGLLASDNFYTTYSNWQAAFTATERNSYIWMSDAFSGESVNDWNRPYAMVAHANIVLEGLEKIQPDPSQQELKDALRGSALFFRAYSFYNLLQLFAQPYGWESSADALGIPMKLEADVNVKTPRSDLAYCYRVIIDNLAEASDLLPTRASHITRPSRPACNALLARIYLNMGNYPLALKHAKMTLVSDASLMDFNGLTSDPTFSFSMPAPESNPEIIFYAEAELYSVTNFRRSNAIVDSILYDLYTGDDLRKAIFFTAANESQQTFFRGQYTSQASPFAGVGLNEVYLILAESSWRTGDESSAFDYMNTLLEARTDNASFRPVTRSDFPDALSFILNERRKELPFTGDLRWQDLRRLNVDPRFQKTLTRELNGEVYTLPPNDKRYVYPIPDDELRRNPTPQNDRES